MTRPDLSAAAAFIVAYSAFVFLGHPIAGLLLSLVIAVLVGCLVDEHGP